MRKFWIFMGILFLIVFGIAIGCAVSDPFKAWFTETTLYIFGETALTVGNWWTGISANPLYQQWHMLIWFVGGIVGTVIFTKILWPRRSRLFPAKQAPPQTYQHDVPATLPQSISEPLPENIAKAKPKQEEAVTA